MDREGLAAMGADGELEAIVAKVLEDNPDVVERIRGGNPKAIGALMGSRDAGDQGPGRRRRGPADHPRAARRLTPLTAPAPSPFLRAGPGRTMSRMAKLIRMDHTGHTVLAEWTAADAAPPSRPPSPPSASSSTRATTPSSTRGEGHAGSRCDELPVDDGSTVILRRPIAGGC